MCNCRCKIGPSLEVWSLFRCSATQSYLGELSRQVQTSELEKVAEVNNAACVETSAKDDINVGEIVT